MLPLPRAAALLLGSGGAGAATMLLLLLSDLQGGAGGAAARLGALAFAFVLAVPLVVGLTAVLHPANGAPSQVKGLATLGTFLWLGGVGPDLFVPTASPGLATAWHAVGLLGGLAFVGAGLAARPLASQQERRRERRARGE